MIKRQRVLSRRIALIALGVIGAWLVVLMTGLNLYVDHRLQSDLTTTLRVRAQAALATVVTKDGRITSVRDAENDTELDTASGSSRTGASSRPPALNRHR